MIKSVDEVQRGTAKEITMDEKGLVSVTKLLRSDFFEVATDCRSTMYAQARERTLCVFYHPVMSAQRSPRLFSACREGRDKGTLT